MSPVVISLLVRALVLLAVAWLAVTILRRQSASLRALVWTAALAGILVLPALTSVAPSIDVPVWRAEASVAPDPSTVVLSSEAGSFDPAVVADLELAGSKDPASGATTSANLTTVSSASAPISWGQAALFAWSLVALALVLRIGLSHLSLSRLAHSSDPASEARDMTWTALVDETRVALGIRRSVRVRTTDAVGVPAMAGLFRPVLLLPAEADDWHEDVKRAVVLHELAHVARWDAAGQLVSQLACAAYWFVPLAWHGARRAAVLREQASDDVVLMSGVRASAYAQNLLNVAQLTGNAALEPASLAMAHPRRIKERIVAILDPASSRTALRSRSLAAVTITAATVVALVATVQPTTQAATPSVTVSSSASSSDPGPTNVGAVTVDAPVTSDTPVTRPLAMRPESEPLVSAPVPQAASLRACDKDMDQSQSSSNDDGRTRRWTVKMSGSNCKVDMRVDGTFEFNDTFTDLKSLSRDGSFKLDVTESGVRREVEILERNGSLARVYRVDGRERSFDTEGQRWFGEFLVTLDRRTAFGVDVRLPMLLKQGGVGAVLAETSVMPSDHARTRYYQKLIAARQLNDGERAQVLKQAASLTKSDHYASEILSEVAKTGFQNSEVRAAALSILDTMDSDHYRATAVENVVGTGRPTAADMDVLVRTVERIKSDHYKLEVLRHIVSGPLQAQHRAALSRAARTVEGDHYAAEFLKALTKGSADGADRQVFFDVIGTIESDHYVLEVLRALVSDRAPSRSEFQQGVRILSSIESDHYKGEAARALLDSRDLTESDLLSLVAAISPMKGDHYKSEALQVLARHRSVNDRVRTAIYDAADRMSSHYREQVRRSAGR